MSRIGWTDSVASWFHSGVTAHPLMAVLERARITVKAFMPIWRSAEKWVRQLSRGSGVDAPPAFWHHQIVIHWRLRADQVGSILARRARFLTLEAA
jgi:hypothetical protein